MRAIIRRPIGRHFTSNVSANSEFFFQLELLKSSFFIARCFGPLSVVSDRPNPYNFGYGYKKTIRIRNSGLTRHPISLYH